MNLVAGDAEAGRPISPGVNVSYTRTEWGCRSGRPRHPIGL